MLELTKEDESDIRIQMDIGLLGNFPPALRALRVRAEADGTLVLVGYFERPPKMYEQELLDAAVAYAASTLYKARLSPRCQSVFVRERLMNAERVLEFEQRQWPPAVFDYWLYIRHGEFEGDEEESANDEPFPREKILEF